MDDNISVILGYSAQDSILYSAIVAVILVHIVLFAFVYKAYYSDKPKIAKKD